MSSTNLKFYQVAEIQISYQNKMRIADCPQIRSSKDAYNILSTNWSDDLELVETFNVLFLNRANRVKGMFTVSKGGITGTVVDARIVFSAALKALACSIIIAHNHPSGNLQASQADITLTKKLATAGEALDIKVLDHVIVTTEGYLSFADEGIL